MGKLIIKNTINIIKIINFSDPEFVATVAHCVYGAQVVEITAGAHNLSQDEPTQQLRLATNLQIFIHESYNPSSYVNDIALIQIADPFVFDGK